MHSLIYKKINNFVGLRTDEDKQFIPINSHSSGVFVLFVPHNRVNNMHAPCCKALSVI